MTIKKKLLINSISVLLLALFMIAFIIYNMLSIQSSTQDEVPNLLNIEELQGKLNTSKQGLNNFSVTATDAQKEEVLLSIAESDKLLAELKRDHSQ